MVSWNTRILSENPLKTCKIAWARRRAPRGQVVLSGYRRAGVVDFSVFFSRVVGGRDAQFLAGNHVKRDGVLRGFSCALARAPICRWCCFRKGRANSSFGFWAPPGGGGGAFHEFLAAKCAKSSGVSGACWRTRHLGQAGGCWEPDLASPTIPLLAGVG